MKRRILAGVIARRGFGRILTVGLMGFFFLYLFISAGAIAIQEKDAGMFFKEIGEEISKPLQKAQEQAIEIHNKEKIKIWDYWGFYFQLYKIYLWFWVVLFIINLFTKDSLPVIARYPLAFIFFALILIAYNSAVLHENLNFTFQVFGDIWNALIHILTKR